MSQGMDWELLARAIAMFVFPILILIVAYKRKRAMLSLGRDDAGSLREEVAILRAKLEQLQEEVERLKEGRGVVRSSSIQEG